jgi:hypothetical protein
VEIDLAHANACVATGTGQHRINFPRKDQKMKKTKTVSTRPQPQLQSVALNQINIADGIQTRVEINPEAVEDYSQSYRQGTNFPPIELFLDGAKHILVDGFHRVEAARKAGLNCIAANVRVGTLTEALVYALQANEKNGLRRSNADKHHCAELALKQWPDYTDRRLARICGVGYDLIGRVRKDLALVSPVRTGLDGKSRRLPKSEEPGAAPGKDQLPASGGSAAPSKAPPAGDAPARGHLEIIPSDPLTHLETMPDQSVGFILMTVPPVTFYCSRKLVLRGGTAHETLIRRPGDRLRQLGQIVTEKLKPGGRLLCVFPEMSSTITSHIVKGNKDLRFEQRGLVACSDYGGVDSIAVSGALCVTLFLKLAPDSPIVPFPGFKRNLLSDDLGPRIIMSRTEDQLWQRLIALFSRSEDQVLIPFASNRAMVKAGLQLKRKCVAIEEDLEGIVALSQLLPARHL